MLLLKAACFVAAGLNIGLIILIFAVFELSWTLSLVAFAFGIFIVGIFTIVGRLLYRAGYERAAQDKLAAPGRALGVTEMNVRSGADGG